MNNELKKLSIDLYNDTNLMYNETSGDQALRNMISEALGGDTAGTIDYYAWEENKNKVFQILAVAIDAVLPTILTNQFDTLADVRSVAIGDKPKFDIEDSSLLRVGLVAAGTQDLQRQELVGNSFTVETDWYGAKAYAELERFLAGEINWKSYINRVGLSFSNKMQHQIYDAFTQSYDGLRATRKESGTYSEDKLFELAELISTASGDKRVAVYGTRSALRAVSKGADMSSNMKDEANRVGYLGTVAGLDLIAIPQAFKAGKEDFALDNKSLLILPQGEKIVSIVLEGQAIVSDKDPMANNSMQKEFLTLKKYGLQVAQASVYGMYNLA